ncbi:arginine--tRNA ligase [Desulfobotulus sp. H1]|uniref:Arginine--tRNA ligase n=1 Tax=Desulfobotulus pelophilus TaxID=2823377 RepID=A0ABT3N6N9_9BACT|nr:arginine--tRNA ligase [Desulfobotulus pelophilus]MCW7753105.1 arginine--tRNA ligase [Desulfobotulus pelophilus]
MKEHLKSLVLKAAERAHGSGALVSEVFPEFEIEVPRAEAHGDFSANIAMVGAKTQKLPPRRIAEILLDHLEDSADILEKTEIAGPGFINFYLKPSAWLPVIRRVLDEGAVFGRVNEGGGRRVQVEFVSANPTGPLHVGHGRGAVVGDAMASILSACGYDVEKEYYINDSGRQILTLGTSVWLRLKEASGKGTAFPEDCYQGDYIKDLALEVKERYPELSALDDEKGIAACARFAADSILHGIKEDLEAFGVVHDKWFSEQSLYDEGIVDAVLKDLEATGIVYEKDGAKWFRTTDWQDEKDRVVVRNNGMTTYFASDIAYHKNKYERGFDRVIDVWGADHHGYIKRIKAAVAATGTDPDRFEVILVQLVALLRNGQPVAMSTRSGEFETLKAVVDEVGKDAARFFFLMRSYETSLDFDLELAKKKSNDNPVFYVQYVHARIASILRKAEEMGIQENLEKLDLLKEPEEIQLVRHLARFPETIALSGSRLEPHRVPFYMMELASAFHTYYNCHKVLGEDEILSSARLALIRSVQQVIRNGLVLLGISAPEEM